MSIELCASMMCANYACLKDEVQSLQEAGIDIFHIDIMDGSFVDNFGMGYQDMKFIKENTTKKVETHLMVKEPYNYLPILFDLAIDIIYIHPEVCADPATIIEKIHKQNLIAGIAINPGTAISNIIELLNVVDRVLVLGVNPGHAGRKYQDYVDNKIFKLIEYKKDFDFEIVLDGAVTIERIKKWNALGVNAFVLGSATLFNKTDTYSEILQKIHTNIKKDKK